jgi:hypothetical protein
MEPSYPCETYQFRFIVELVSIGTPEVVPLATPALDPTTPTPAQHRPRPIGIARTIGMLAEAVVVSVLVNSIVAAVAHAAGASTDFPPLTVPVHGAFALVGIVVGWLGWSLVQRFARRPAHVMVWLVPVFAVVSFAPDVALGVLQFIPGTTWTATR